MHKEHDVPIIILGMHRSGTSALAGCLHLLGVHFGNALMAGNRSNPAGYFEHLDVWAVHENLLADLGSRWDMIGALPEGWAEGEAAKQAARSLVGIVERQFLGHGVWAVKDPRTTRLMPVWVRALDSLGLTPRFVHVVRHPAEVARSVQARDGMDVRTANLLWLAHQWDAERATAGHPRARIAYDDLLADPVPCLQSLADALGVVLPRRPADHARELSRFVRPELKHHHASAADEGGTPPSEASRPALLDVDERLRAALSASNSNGEPEPLVHLTETLLARIGELERREHDAAIERERRLAAAGETAEPLYAQVYFPGHHAGSYRDPALTRLLVADAWQRIEVDVPSGALARGRLRLDPLNTRGTVAITDLGLFRATDGQPVWPEQPAEGLAACTVASDGFVVAEGEALEIVCTDADPQLLLPSLPELPDVPLRLRVWLNPSRSLRALAPRWSELVESLEASRDERATMQTEIAQAARRADEERQALGGELAAAEARLAETERRALEDAEASRRRLEDHNRALADWFHRLQEAFEELLTTRRWRLGNALVETLARARLRRREIPSALTAARRVLDEAAAAGVSQQDAAPPRGVR